MTPVATPAPPPSARTTRVAAVRGSSGVEREDAVAVEEPLEIRVRHGALRAQTETTVGLTMRTPGHDFELAVGLLHSEGIVATRTDVVHIAYCAEEGARDYQNAVVVELDAGVVYRPEAAERSYLRTSACGVCGRASLESLAMRKLPARNSQRPRVPDAALRALPARLREAQKVFAATGGLHAAALFDAQGRIRSLREDVGRHNAVDKLVGAELLAGRLPLLAAGLLVSGRASYEIMQKAVVAGVPLVAAIGAPSSLAVDVAQEFGQTLIGFLKEDGYNVYAGAARVDSPRVVTKK